MNAAEEDPNSTPASAQQITITIKPLKGGNPFPLTVTPLQPIDEIKTLIATQCGVPASAQRLVFNGKGLTDGKTLLDYEIPTGATLNLLQKPGSAARPSKASTIDAAAPMPAAAGVKRKEDGPALKENNVGETNNFVVAAKKKATDAAFWGDLRNVLRGHFADGSHLDKVVTNKRKSLFWNKTKWGGLQVFNNFTQSYQALCGDLGPEERVAFQKASAQS
ncbi:hypothetical protein HK104_008389 [Borealophlyctis nickersoniae]|nr:hypothetical protein HK104_008389 [Borealophlyctis nickersoniae]